MESLVLSIRLERRWPVAAMLGVALAWLVAAVVQLVPLPPPASTADLARIALAILPPLALALLAAALLPAAARGLPLPELEGRLADSQGLLGSVEAQLGRVEALLGRSLDQADRLAGTGLPALADQAAAIEATTTRVVGSGEATQRLVDGFGAALPALERTMAAIDATLRSVGSDSATQLRAVETMLAAVQARNRDAAGEADSAIAAMTALLARIDDTSTRTTATLSKRAYALDAAVDGVLERTTAAVDGIRERVTGQLSAMQAGIEQGTTQLTIFGDDGARRFNQRIELLVRTSEQVSEQFAAQERGAERVQAAVMALLGEMEARVAAFGTAGTATTEALRDAAETHFGALDERLARLRADGGSTADAIGAQLADTHAEMQASVATLLADLDARFKALAASGAATTEALHASADSHFGALDARIARSRDEGAAAADAIAARVAAADADLASATSARLAEFEARFADVEASGTAALDAVAARIADIDAAAEAAATARLAALEARFEAVRAAGSTAAAAINTDLAAIEASLAGLAAPLGASQAAVAGLGTESQALDGVVAALEATIAERLADTRAAMAALHDETDRLTHTVTTLGSSVADGSNLVSAASANFGAERDAVVGLARELAGHFDTARAALADLESGSAAAAASIAAGLGGEVSRLGDATETAVAAMRSALAKVVDDAVAALADAAGSRAEMAFGAPVRDQISAIETAASRAAAAGQQASERLATQMLSLVETVGVVEARIDEVEAQHAIRARDSLASRAARLIEALNAAVVDVAQLLSLSVSDGEWAAYLRGDRSVFARAVAPQLDREVARRIARMLQHDPAFRSEAVRFTDMFEALIQRLLGDRDGEALAATMLSADLGKLYIAITDAGERLPPSRKG